MKAMILSAITAILVVSQSVSFSASDRSVQKIIVIALQDAPKVELYIASWCPYCQKAMKFFESRRIPYVVYDIERNEAAARRKKQLDGRNGVPFAVINGKRIHGFSEEAYLRALNPESKTESTKKGSIVNKVQ